MIPCRSITHGCVLSRLGSSGSLHNRRFMSQARRTRHFARSARRGEEKKIKRLYHFIVLSFPTFTTQTSRSNWLIYDALHRRDSGMLSGTKWPWRSHVFLTMLIEKALRLLRIVPEIKEKQKKCLNLLLIALFKKTRILKFKSQLRFGFFAAVNNFSNLKSQIFILTR